MLLSKEAWRFTENWKWTKRPDMIKNGNRKRNNQKNWFYDLALQNLIKDYLSVMVIWSYKFFMWSRSFKECNKCTPDTFHLSCSATIQSHQYLHALFRCTKLKLPKKEILMISQTSNYFSVQNSEVLQLLLLTVRTVKGKGNSRYCVADTKHIIGYSIVSWYRKNV